MMENNPSGLKTNIHEMPPLSDSISVTNPKYLPRSKGIRKDVVNNTNHWHRFVVYNTENSSRNEVLEAILDHIFPLDLIPVSYWKNKNTSYFLARNCGPAIEKLCKNNLIVCCKKTNSLYKLSITIKFTTTKEFKIDVQKNVSKVLSKRYNTVTRTLDLRNFLEDPDLIEYCALSQPKILFFVLHLSKALVPPPDNYILSDNKIKLFSAIDAFNKIKSLDLSNNLIENFNVLAGLNSPKINELYLDGNPLCDNLTNAEYISNATSCINGLTILDGVPIKTGSLPSKKKLFLCNPEALDLVDQFLERYFFIYDSQNRKLIQDLYHKQALFSLNSVYHNSQLSSATTRIHKYNLFSRNLYKLADILLNHKNLYKGSTTIVNILNNLPATEHDPLSFLVDLIYYTPKCAVIGVSGTFRECPESLLDSEKLYGFRRTFTLELNKNGLCYITNEEFHVHNAFSWQILEGFKISKPILPSTLNMTPQTEEDHQTVIEGLKTISTLNSEWSKKCLEECDYDLKKALNLFINLYKQNRIPQEGFETAKKKSDANFDIYSY
ncbi:unnamed protein product [Phyllotreta striolata]|uniref:Nuclear RNA export factor 1 n=1 Tax=Phyllotreta striolata TaxID=444603 RepID=A0A9N9TPP5_PHYSR|nr:unnamed protein product [Phyllotreta striolata]